MQYSKKSWSKLRKNHIALRFFVAPLRRPVANSDVYGNTLSSAIPEGALRKYEHLKNIVF